MIVTAYIPVYFQKVFPGFKSSFALINAAALTLFGFSSSIVGGIISDKYGKKSYMTNSLIVMTGNFLAVPLILLACLTSNFWIAIVAFALKILVSGSYFAPALTMM